MTMAGCEKFIEQISALVDAELSAEEEAAVLEHIAKCQVCCAVYESFCEIAKCMPQITVEPPSDLKDSIMRKVRAEANARRRRPPFLRYIGLAAVFALVMLAAVNGNKVFAPDSSENTPSLRLAASMENASDAAKVETPENNFGSSANEDCGEEGIEQDSLDSKEKGFSTCSISDMRKFIKYLESLPPEEYKNAVDEYQGELYAVLVLEEDDVPSELKDTNKLLENNSEIYLKLSREEIENLSKNSDDGMLIVNDEGADKGIVIIKKDEE